MNTPITGELLPDGSTFLEHIGSASNYDKPLNPAQGKFLYRQEPVFKVITADGKIGVRLISQIYRTKNQ